MDAHVLHTLLGFAGVGAMRRERPGLLPTWASALFIVALSITAMLQLLNVVGLFFDRAAGPYLAGLLVLLCVAAMQFAFLVTSELRSQ